MFDVWLSMTLAASFTMDFSTGERDQQRRFTVRWKLCDRCRMGCRSDRGMGRMQASYRYSKDGNDSPRKEMSEGERAVSATQSYRGRKAVIRIYPNRIKCDGGYSSWGSNVSAALIPTH